MLSETPGRLKKLQADDHKIVFFTNQVSVMYLLALNLYIKLDAVWIDLDAVDINLDALLHSANANDLRTASSI